MRLLKRRFCARYFATFQTSHKAIFQITQASHNATFQNIQMNNKATFQSFQRPDDRLEDQDESGNVSQGFQNVRLLMLCYSAALLLLCATADSLENVAPNSLQQSPTFGVKFNQSPENVVLLLLLLLLQPRLRALVAEARGARGERRRVRKEQELRSWLSVLS